MKLSERITRWREAKGMSKAELARKTGKSSAAVAQWEDDGPDGTEPTHDSVNKIAKAFEVSLSEFWGDPPKKKARPS